MSDQAIWAVIAVAALWVLGLPFVFWRMVRSGAMERSVAKAEARARARQPKPIPKWARWLGAFWLGHFINWVVFMALGQGIRAAGVDVTEGAAMWILGSIAFASWITTSVLIYRSWSSGGPTSANDHRVAADDTSADRPIAGTNTGVE